MNKVIVTGEFVIIEIEGWDKLWSFKGELKIPRKAIVTIYPRPSDLKPPWLKSLGTYLPSIIASGTYRGSDRKEFWNTHFDTECVVFDLVDFDYTRVVVDVPNVQELIDQID